VLACMHVYNATHYWLQLSFCLCEEFSMPHHFTCVKLLPLLRICAPHRFKHFCAPTKWTKCNIKIMQYIAGN